MGEQSRARDLLVATADARRRGDLSVARGIALLLDLRAEVVDREVEAMLLDRVDAAWCGGWQPSELVRQGTLGTSSKAAGRLAAWAVATDHTGRRSATLDRRWVEQVEGLDLPAVSGRPGWFRAWVQAEGPVGGAAVEAAVDLLACWGWLPRLDPILPPPGSHHPGAAPAPPSGTAGADADPVLVKVRNLLAKAESTTFEAEAMALTAKAHELMARHAVDAAQLGGPSVPDDERPTTVRLPIDAPYVVAKSLLLQIVAQAGRCRSACHTGLGLSTVVGFAADVAAVEMLFTSLLVQAQSALAGAAEHAPPGTRTRRRSYRSAFLLSFAQRIGDRLDEINAAVLAQAEARHGPALLPVLRSRSDVVDDHFAERFGQLTTSQVRGGWDPAGWAGGRVAADNAQLSGGHLDGGAAPGPHPGRTLTPGSTR